MNPCPREPGEFPAQPYPTCLKDCETSSDNGHISFIEVSERLGGGLTKQTLGDSTTCIATLLNGHLGDTRQWFTVLFKGSGISDYIYVWISGNSEIVLNANAAGAVRLHVRSPSGHSVPNFEFEDGARIGELMHDGQAMLLDFESNASLKTLGSEYGERIKYVSGRAKEQFGLSAALIRPDGVIAWAYETDPDYSELQNAAARWLMKESI